MENDPDKLDQDDDAAIGDETDDVDSDTDGVVSDEADETHGGVDPTADIMDNGTGTSAPAPAL